MYYSWSTPCYRFSHFDGIPLNNTTKPLNRVMLTLFMSSLEDSAAMQATVYVIYFFHAQLDNGF